MFTLLQTLNSLNTALQYPLDMVKSFDLVLNAVNAALLSDSRVGQQIIQGVNRGVQFTNSQVKIIKFTIHTHTQIHKFTT